MKAAITFNCQSFKKQKQINFYSSENKKKKKKNYQESQTANGSHKKAPLKQNNALKLI